MDNPNGPSARCRASGPPGILKFTVFSIIAFPPYMVIKTIGASGNVGELLALGLLILWLTSSLFGLHHPWRFGHPGRAAMLLWLLASCASYVALFAGQTGVSDQLGRSAADRWMLLVLAGAGLTLVIAETVQTLEHAMSLVRWMLAGAVFCTVIAIIQFTMRIDPLDFLTQFMVGFTNNDSSTVFQSRGNFMRVAGTTLHPIELGTACSMLLPLSVWRALYDRAGRKWIHWATTVLILLGNVMTVSRTGLIGLAIVIVVGVPFLPRLARRWAYLAVPTAIVGLFVAVPGMVSTLFSTSSEAMSDTSITHRTDTYPLALKLVFARPWFGLGPGTWIPVDMTNNFDNQYLLTVATLGLVGVLAMILYLGVPAFASLTAAFRMKERSGKYLAASIAAAMFVALVASGTFDSMSFPVFALLVPVFVGLGGTTWRLFKAQAKSLPSLSASADSSGTAPSIRRN